MDSDKVLVMDTGRVAEYEHPHLLLQNPDGEFSKLVAETGPTMSANLHDIARRAYEEKYDRTTF